jgi:hypothetical protein
MSGKHPDHSTAPCADEANPEGWEQLKSGGRILQNKLFRLNEDLRAIALQLNMLEKPAAPVDRANDMRAESTMPFLYVIMDSRRD